MLFRSKGAKALANKIAPAILPQQPSPLGFNPQPNLYGAGMGSAYAGGAMMSPMGMPQQQQFGMVNQPTYVIIVVMPLIIKLVIFS